jgi:hypothetical protein
MELRRVHELVVRRVEHEIRAPRVCLANEFDDLAP